MSHSPHSTRPASTPRWALTSFWAAPASSRLDVGVQPEQVVRVVALLERCKPRVVVAVCGVHAGLAIVGGGQIGVLPVGLWLHLRPGAPYPLGPARHVLGRHGPRLEHTHVVTRAAVEERRILRPYATDGAALVLQPHQHVVERGALGKPDQG